MDVYTQLVVVITIVGVGLGVWWVIRIGNAAAIKAQNLEFQKQQEKRLKQEAHEQAHERSLREAHERNVLREYEEWRLRNNVLVDKFLEITERKVSLLDDYGDENWDALPKEIEKVLLKIARDDNDGIDDVETIKWLYGFKSKGVPLQLGSNFQLREGYLLRKSNLESEFRSYHESRKGQPNSSDFADLSGIDFETYLAKLLSEHGFEDIRGTSTTGDQGADLIAKRNGKTIVIQAKRYQGSVGNRAVQEVAGAIKFYGADEGWVITSGTFTSSAKALAQKNNVRLIDGHALRNRDFV